ncbi:MAG: ATP-binding protein [Pseudomonadota bacterium]
MIPVENALTVESNIELMETNLGFDAEGMVFIGDILQNRLYSNKVLAAIREPSTNALDAMVVAGKADQPFLVTLPNALAPQFRVRDYGSGLTDAEMRTLYANYGASDKRKSNDVLGQMGIGKFAPLSYTKSNFLVVSYKGGEARTYSISCKSNKISPMSVDVTTEPDGLEVIVEVRENDIQTFITECATFFQFFKVRPTFKGAEIKFNEVKPLFSDANGLWVIPGVNDEYARSPLAVMGGVPYKIDAEAINWEGKQPELKTLLESGIIMRFNIGDIELIVIFK